MSKVTLSFIISSIAGLSTMIGCLFTFIKVKSIDNIINNALSFAAGVMITVSITDLLPSAFNELLNSYYYLPSILICILFLITGICLSFIINKYLPDTTNTNDFQLYRVGIVTMIAIILHNIPEGIATFMASSKNMELGISLAIAITIHNIPEGIGIAIPIYFSTRSHTKSLLYTFVSGISELFGALLAYMFLYNYMNNIVMGIILSLVAGIMSYISLIELFPYVLKFNHKKRSYSFFGIGILFMLITHCLF